MSRNGSGVYSPSATGYPAVAGTTIESSKYNAVLADLATALTGSIACNGESTITGNIPMATYKITGLGNASADTDALNRVTADGRYALLSGATFTGAVYLSAAAPELYIRETDATADEKLWRVISVSGNFSLYTMTDAGVAGDTPLVISRTGTTVDTITFAGTTFTVSATTCNINVTTLNVNSIDITPTGGTFTAYLRATDNGANLASGTATWKKARGVVTLFLPSLTATTAATSALYIDGLPAEIFPVSAAQYLLTPGYDAGNETAIKVQVGVAGDYLLITPFNASTFTAGSTTKGVVATTLTWML